MLRWKELCSRTSDTEGRWFVADRLEKLEAQVEETNNTVADEEEEDLPEEEEPEVDPDEEPDEEPDGDEEISADQAIQVLRGHIADLGGGDNGISERLNEVNQTLYTTTKMIRRAHPKVVAGVWDEIEELRRLVASLPKEKPMIKVVGFKPPVTLPEEE